MKEPTIIDNPDLFSIEGTQISPHIILDKENQMLIIEGNSMLSTSYNFYKNIFKQLESIFQEHKFDKLDVIIHFIYINTQGIKEIISLINLLEKSKIPVHITWFYSDEDINDLGTQICELTKLDFEIKYKKPLDIEFGKNEE